MTPMRLTFCCTGLSLLAACSREPPPVPVAEFMENSRLLEATLVRCGQDRARLKYTSECVNAREAADRIEVREKRARHAELEAQSIRKRQALRQTQEAAAEARRRAQEEERRQEEAELMGLYETPGPGQAAETAGSGIGGAATADPLPGAQAADELPAPPVTDAESGESGIPEIREELRRRQPEPQG